MSTEPDLDLARRLTAVADRAPYAAPDAGLDLARGRRRVRRRRIGAGVVGAAAAATVALALLPGGAALRVEPAPAPAQQGTSPSTAVDDTAVSASERELARGESLDVTTSSDLLAAAAEGYARVVAERLDPGGRHAVLPTENLQSGGGVDDLSWVGTRIGWRVPGQDGQGVVSVRVGGSPGSAEWSCDQPGWTCADVAAPAGATAARTATHDGGSEVMVRRVDGLVVTLAVRPLDVNNSLVPVTGLDVPLERLLAAATDPRLVLPDARDPDVLAVPGIEDRLAGDALVQQVGREVLLPPTPGERAERLGGGPTDGGHEFRHAWRWAGPQGRATVSWSVDGSPSARESGTCIAAYERCVVHTQDGREVFVGYRRQGRGWDVWAPGPVRTLSVSSTGTGTGTGTGADVGTGFPIDRALDLVLDPRLQVAPRR